MKKNKGEVNLLVKFFSVSFVLPIIWVIPSYSSFVLYAYLFTLNYNLFLTQNTSLTAFLLLSLLLYIITSLSYNLEANDISKK